VFYPRKAALRAAIGAKCLVALALITPTMGHTNPAGDELRRERAIDFGPCPQEPTIECGTLRVPLEHGVPRSEQITLAVVRVPALQSGKKLGVLFVNPGGPGFSGVDFVLQGLHAPIMKRLRESFDVVSFDPRGSGKSGAVRCDIGDRIDPARTDAARLPALFDEFGSRIIRACEATNSRVLTTMTTNNIARDVDALRAALGEKQITYLGISFGTELGAVYASLFPQRVRLMLLDAAVPPERRDSFVEFVVGQSGALELVLHRLDLLCRQQPACPLKSTGVVAALDTIMGRVLTRAPSQDGVSLDSENIRDVVAASLYVEVQWPVLVRGISNALNGDYSFFIARAPDAAALMRRATNGKVFDSYDALLCNNFGTRRKAKDILEVDSVNGAAHPRFFGRYFLAGEVMRCGAWPPAEIPIISNVEGKLGKRILLIGNDFDPSTPLSWTRSMARALGVEGNVVRYEGGGHGVITFGVPCVDEMLVQYLTTEKLPPRGFSCSQRPLKFDVS
jgi:pimeloyl-ACP methyl ester carboxylesterase